MMAFGPGGCVPDNLTVEEREELAQQEKRERESAAGLNIRAWVTVNGERKQVVLTVVEGEEALAGISRGDARDLGETVAEAVRLHRKRERV